jgi:hypothetical protein
MSELASYFIQATFFALVAVVVISRSKKTDLYQFALISIWLIGVTAIFARYGEDQVLFYSNDQLFHQQVIDHYLPVDGIQLNAVINLRYLLTVPVYLISLLGFNAMLVIKFFQLSALLLIFTKVKALSKRYGFKTIYLQIPLFAGPLPIFMSLIGLRDVILAYLTLISIFPTNPKLRIVSVVATGLLRPHLAVAIVFGFMFEILHRKLHTRFQVILSALFLMLSYFFGAIGFAVGNFATNRISFYLPATIFSVEYISRLALNIVGLQFLVLDGNAGLVVASSSIFLFISRLLFVETFLVPILFFTFFFRQRFILKKESLQVSAAMFFFLGLVFQNTVSTNSTRQNLPFITLMGVIVVIQVLHECATRRQQHSVEKIGIPRA